MRVSATERTLLERVVRAQSSPQALARRARMILLGAEGQRNEPIAAHLGCSRIQVRQWRNRWAASRARLSELEAAGAPEDVLLAEIVAVLSDRPRSGRPSSFTAEQICQIIAVACEPPVESGREVTHWTPRELAQEAVERGIVESVSTRTIGRFLGAPR